MLNIKVYHSNIFHIFVSENINLNLLRVWWWYDLFLCFYLFTSLLASCVSLNWQQKHYCEVLYCWIIGVQFVFIWCYIFAVDDSANKYLRSFNTFEILSWPWSWWNLSRKIKIRTADDERSNNHQVSKG